MSSVNKLFYGTQSGKIRPKNINPNMKSSMVVKKNSERILAISNQVTVQTKGYRNVSSTINKQHSSTISSLNKP